LPGATSAVMELCLDNPREGPTDLFATHPSVESRVQALVKYAGGHDSGPLALPMHADPDDQAEPPEQGQQTDQVPPPLPAGPSSGAQSGPWGANPGSAPQGAPQTSSQNGPWADPAGPWGRR
jgi:heat shock protein HtpX